MTRPSGGQTPGRLETGIILAEQDPGCDRELQKLSGVKLNRCLHCRSCANGCPFTAAMDYPPHAILRLLQLGLLQEALESHTIWICAGCHTCSVQCPMEISLAAVMNSLRQLALKEGVKVAEPDILDFHRAVNASIRRFGRTHELGVMMRYKARMRRWFTDLDLGLKMLARGKMELRAHRVKALQEIRRLFHSRRPG
ncbi:MAG: 4Fe-4S dicluster domain-containing protein [Desulfobaccales bacterium]